jgi:hypothetical protein
MAELELDLAALFGGGDCAGLGQRTLDLFGRGGWRVRIAALVLAQFWEARRHGGRIANAQPMCKQYAVAGRWRRQQTVTVRANAGCKVSTAIGYCWG